MQPPSRDFFTQDTVSIAQSLLGMLIVRKTAGKTLIAQIVETEAYCQDDPASHSFNGQTKRAKPMFANGGISYVYFIYGMYDCFNIVTGPKGYGGAVLIRAIEPITEVSTMWKNRFPKKEYPKQINQKQLSSITNGPGKLCKALSINTAQDNQKDLTTSDIKILENSNHLDFEIISDYRIGIKKATDKEWRFYIKDNPYVSKL